MLYWADDTRPLPLLLPYLSCFGANALESGRADVDERVYTCSISFLGVVFCEIGVLSSALFPALLIMPSGVIRDEFWAFVRLITPFLNG